MALLDSEQNGPEVIWNTEMRKRLLDHLTTELESYVKFRATNPLALYIHVPRTRLAYPELAGRVQGLGLSYITSSYIFRLEGFWVICVLRVLHQG